MGSEHRNTDSQQHAPEVVCLGETMLMLAPPPNELIEYCHHFTVLLGGAEANTAIGLERLGLHAGWIGKLPRNALGQRIVNETRSFGVDTSAVVWTEEGRVGLFFVEWGARPRRIQTIYDRAGSTTTTLVPEELDWDYISKARCLHLTGITPALGKGCLGSIRDIAAQARSAGLMLSFDMNYRSMLWSEPEARVALTDILPYTNLLVATEAEAAILLGTSLERHEAISCLLDRYSLDVVVMTLGEEGAIAFDGQRVYHSPGYVVQPVNRLGAGDAFTAGMLFGYLRSGVQSGLDYGTAMAALKMTIPQNIPLSTKADVERLFGNCEADVLR
ncbi:MAG: sugar kinase [Chloroflexi bacterium]|nr:sugar kinase [Chloroflexota bacterium]